MKQIIINGIDLTDGDKRILIATNEELSARDGFELKNALEEQFPTTKFVIISGAQVVAIPEGPTYDFEVTDE